MRIFYYLDSPFYSGAEMQVIRNAKAFSLQGLEVTVCCNTSEDFACSIIKKLEGSQVRILAMRPLIENRGRFSRLINNRVSFIQTFLWARGLLLKNRPEVVHVNNGGYPGATGVRAFALAASGSPGVGRVVFSVNNLAVPYKHIYRWLQAPVDFLLARSKINWVTASRAAAKRLLSVLNLAPDQVSVIPNGISGLSCTCEPGTTTGIVIPSDLVIATQIGHLESRKAHAKLIDAVARLKESGHISRVWRFILEGEGPLKAELETQVMSRGLSEQIKIVGRSECVYHLLKRTDILIHPSTENEDLPNVISEAMSLGIPVIGSKVGGIVEQIDHDCTGLLVEPGSEVELAEAIYKLMSNLGLRSKLGGQGLSKFKQNFSEAKALAAYKALYFD